MHENSSGSYSKRRKQADDIRNTGDRRRPETGLDGKCHPESHDGKTGQENEIPLKKGNSQLIMHDTHSFR